MNIKTAVIDKLWAQALANIYDINVADCTYTHDCLCAESDKLNFRWGR